METFKNDIVKYTPNIALEIININNDTLKALLVRIL